MADFVSKVLFGTKVQESVSRRTGYPNGPSSHGILSECAFAQMLCLERKRTERSGNRFVLMLVEAEGALQGSAGPNIVDRILHALAELTRETDIKGWYKEGSIIGVIFTEIGTTEGRAVAKALLAKVSDALSNNLTIEQISAISLSLHVFPEDWERQAPNGPADSTLYPELLRDLKKAPRLVKRSMDILGSLMVLTVLAPLLVVIAIAVKLTSRGPIFFRQERLGQYGKRFTFLKFRSMYFKSDPKIHQEFVERLISGNAVSQAGRGGENTVYKLTADPRITRVGRLLRRTSLDELPQFLNVLRGEMSLVGPRPPIGYEVERYDIWHRRRLLAVKPGITGLWQVGGRSKTTFDEMVRLDIAYTESWSLWMDIKILLLTPRAVLIGAGAY